MTLLMEMSTFTFSSFFVSLPPSFCCRRLRVLRVSACVCGRSAAAAEAFLPCVSRVAHSLLLFLVFRRRFASSSAATSRERRAAVLLFSSTEATRHPQSSSSSTSSPSAAHATRAVICHSCLPLVSLCPYIFSNFPLSLINRGSQGRGTRLRGRE